MASIFEGCDNHISTKLVNIYLGQLIYNSVGTDHDTASFAVETIRRWWNTMGRQRYPAATELVITADGGGSNGSRVRLWKLELQRLADEINIPIHISHLPPGTSKWNKIEQASAIFLHQHELARPALD